MADIDTARGGYLVPAAARDPRRPILCLHCSTGSSRQWRSLEAALGRACRIIAPDLLGYGDNPPWEPGRALSLAAEVRRLLPLLPGEPVDVVAHSFGAAVAVKLALDHPHRVRSLTLYEPVLFGLLEADSDAHGAIAEIDAIRVAVGGALADGDTDTAARRFVDFWSGDGAWAGTPEARRAPVRTRIYKVRADFRALIADRTTRADLERLDVPALCLSGARSPEATRRIVDVLARALPRAERRCFAGAGHLGPLTHADDVNACIVEFLRFLFRQRDERAVHTRVTARAA